MTNYFTYPLNTTGLLRKKRAIRRELSNRKDLDDKRIAILGGSTTAEVRDMLELFLLHAGIRPVFYESEYNRYFEDVMFPESGLKSSISIQQTSISGDIPPLPRTARRSKNCLQTR